MRTQKRTYIATGLIAICLLLLSACSTVPMYAPDQVASVARTKWVGTDSDGDYYEFLFQASGALHYRSPSGFWTNSRWTQDGSSIYFEMNDKYSEYRGQISGNQMEGKAWNIKGRKWTWKVQKKE